MKFKEASRAKISHMCIPELNFMLQTDELRALYTSPYVISRTRWM